MKEQFYELAANSACFCYSRAYVCVWGELFVVCVSVPLLNAVGKAA